MYDTEIRFRFYDEEGINNPDDHSYLCHMLLNYINKIHNNIFNKKKKQPNA